MKQAEVKTGEVYLTRIGPVLARVVVRWSTTTYDGRTRFVVQRVGESRPLPKARSAAALRPVTPGWTDDIDPTKLPMWRCTRPGVHGPNTPGHTDPGARQGYYERAASAEDARRLMRDKFPGETIDVEPWK